jgi:hypothetical protein
MDLYNAQGLHACMSGTFESREVPAVSALVGTTKDEQDFASQVIASFQQRAQAFSVDALNGIPQSTFENLMDKAVRDVSDMVNSIDTRALVSLVSVRNPAVDEDLNSPVSQFTDLADRPFEILVELSLMLAEDGTQEDYGRILCVAKDNVIDMLVYFMRLVGDTTRGIISAVFKTMRNVVDYLGIGTVLGKIKALVVTCVARVASIPATLIAYLKRMVSNLCDALKRWTMRIDTVINHMAHAMVSICASLYEAMPETRIHVRQVVLYTLGLPELLLDTAKEFGADTVRVLQGSFQSVCVALNKLLSMATLATIQSLIDRIGDSKGFGWLVRAVDGIENARQALDTFMKRSYIGRIALFIMNPMQTFFGLMVTHIGAFFSSYMPRWLHVSNGKPASEAEETIISLVKMAVTYGAGKVPTTLLSNGNLEETRDAFDAVVAWRKAQGNASDVKRITRVQRRIRALEQRASNARTDHTNLTTRGMTNMQLLAHHIAERVRDLGSGAWALAGAMAAGIRDSPTEVRSREKRAMIEQLYEAPEVKRFIQRRLGTSKEAFSLRAASIEARMAAELELMTLDRLSIARPSRLDAATLANAYKYTPLGLPEDNPVTAVVDTISSDLATTEVHYLIRDGITPDNCKMMVARCDAYIKRLHDDMGQISEEKPAYIQYAALRRSTEVTKTRFSAIYTILTSPSIMEKIKKISDNLRNLKIKDERDDNLSFYTAIAIMGISGIAMFYATYIAERAVIVENDVKKFAPARYATLNDGLQYAAVNDALTVANSASWGLEKTSVLAKNYIDTKQAEIVSALNGKSDIDQFITWVGFFKATVGANTELPGIGEATPSFWLTNIGNTLKNTWSGTNDNPRTTVGALETLLKTKGTDKGIMTSIAREYNAYFTVDWGNSMTFLERAVYSDANIKTDEILKRSVTRLTNYLPQNVFADSIYATLNGLSRGINAITSDSTLSVALVEDSLMEKLKMATNWGLLGLYVGSIVGLTFSVIRILVYAIKGNKRRAFDWIKYASVGLSGVFAGLVNVRDFQQSLGDVSVNTITNTAVSLLSVISGVSGLKGIISNATSMYKGSGAPATTAAALNIMATHANNGSEAGYINDAFRGVSDPKLRESFAVALNRPNFIKTIEFATFCDVLVTNIESAEPRNASQPQDRT